ncbi:MAG: phosphoribosylanthranilate isomerase [Acidobacteriia bacterium]|nr:phosphoribosylanthranilate isomerase [Terriglobia bacterium]
MVRAKICGITNWPDARAACDAGADALGFNFYAPSPRAISPAAAWAIIRRLPPFVAPVGIFVNWTSAAVLSLASALHLAAVQLSGDESPRDIAACARRSRVIRVVRVGANFSPARLRPSAGVAAFLLDAAKTGQYGGTGKTFSWPLARRAARSHRIILAGGLTLENVAEAILLVRPYAVDVASGVESRSARHGKKDLGKLRAFLAEVARANRLLAADARKTLETAS